MDAAAGVPRARVLVVDDSLVLLKLCKQWLERGGYHPTCVASAEGALELLGTATCDLILLDVNLPGGLDGYGLLSKLRESHVFRSIPVLMMSADDMEESVVRLARASSEAHSTVHNILHTTFADASSSVR